MTVLAPAPRQAAPVAEPLPRLDPIASLPIVTLYPHSRCNCRCGMCDIWKIKERAELTVSDIERWLPEWRALGVRRIVLSGGEPLLCSHLWELCEPVRAAGIGITILSTGLLLARDAASLVRFCDDVVVSLDGPRAVHDRIRNVPRAFERLAEGVAAVRAADPQVALSGRCTVQRENCRELAATVEAAREIGLDRISFLAADVTSEAFNRPGGWDRERAAAVALSAEELPALRSEIEALRETDFAAGFIAETREKLLQRLAGYFAAQLGLGDFPALECNAPWVSGVVESDGTLRPCFFHAPLGNAREGGFAAILNAPAALAWRRGLDVARDETCRRCVCSLNLRP